MVVKYTNDYYILRETVGDHVYIDTINLNEILDCKDFPKYCSMREKLPNSEPKRFYGVFGPDFVRHFEIAYQIFKEKEKKN